MENLIQALQVVVALGILNVWLLRAGKASRWRGGEATDLRSEFETYGLPPWSRRVVGFLKVSLAIFLLLGIWFPALTRPAAAGMAVLMAGAVAMHLKVGDPLLRSLPAATLLVCCLIVVLL